MTYHYTPPDVTPGGTDTLWSVNYMSWLVGEMLSGTTPTMIPAIDRMETSKAVLVAAIDLINPDGFNDNVLFGLTTFSSGGDPDGEYEGFASPALPIFR